LEEEDELQLPNLMEEEAVEMAIAQSELNRLQWDGLAVQLRASELAQGRPPTPPATPPALTPPPATHQPLDCSWPWVPLVFINLADDDDEK
jgi:hypothetical protein